MKTINQLAELVKGAEVIGNKETVITGIEHDSRKVEKGTLFVCIPGIHVDGGGMAVSAVRNETLGFGEGIRQVRGPVHGQNR